jgi:plastocyanin
MNPARAAWLLACLAAPAFAAPHRVVIEGMRFTPQVLQVRPGDTITWENRDMVAHNVTARTGSVRSGDLQPGQSWRYKVERGASFDYLCTLHPMMTGRVEFEAAAPHARAKMHDPPAK